MTWLLYLSNVIFARTESALGKYSGKRGGDPFTFNRGKTVAAALLCAIFAIFSGIEFHGGTVILALIYGGASALSMHAGLVALSLGSMAIVSMLASLSLIIPTLWGLVFLNESISLFGIVGLLLIALSILLLNLKKGGGKISVKCWIYSILTMVANGVASIVQKYHQAQNPSKYRIEFMLISMGFACLIFMLLWLKAAIAEKNRSKPASQKRSIKEILTQLPLILGFLAGTCNCFANFSILFLAESENASLLFPILSAANAIGACLVGKLVFKERLTPLQLISICLGILSVVLLKI